MKPMPITATRRHDFHAPETAPTPDLAAIKARQQATWAAGDYGQIGTRLQIVGESLVEAVDLRATDQVLDVAAGNGNASLAAARHFAHVTSTDYVPALLEEGRRRAEADGLPITFQMADAEALPFDDASFDVVLSVYGVMFTPDQNRAAAELLRVTVPGGKIGLANWTPEGFIGKLFKLVGGFVPPPAGLRPPAVWGTEPRLVELFGPHAAEIRAVRKNYTFRFRSADHWIEIFRTYYGPVHRAFAALDAEKQREFHAALHAFLMDWNQGGEHDLRIPSEYLEVVLVKS